MSTQQQIAGMYQHAGSSSLYPATATISASGHLLVLCQNSQQVLCRAGNADYRFGTALPGLAVELQLRDGALFIPDDKQFRWPQLSRKATITERLESHKLAIVAAILLTPLLLWWLVIDLTPKLASAAVPLVPEQVKQQMGRQTFYALQKTALRPTTLAAPQQATIHYHWQMALQKLPLQYHNYTLYLFDSGVFGANAFALPDGTVVLTDDLANLLQDNPDAILAVLLHEIGHVEGQHSVRLVAQSLGTALLFGVIAGDAEGIAELLLGSGSTMLQNAFSRDMEREADQFALQQLVALGKSPTAFADAMTALLTQSSANSDTDMLLKYLSTHPDTAQRIEQARNYSKP